MTFLLETQRLIFRKFQEEDAEGMFRLNSDADVIRYTGDDPFTSIEEARSFIQQYDAYKTSGYGRLTLLLKDTMEYIGWCGLRYDVNSRETDLGFRLLKSHWNKGFATEASMCCLQDGFQRLGLERIIGRAMMENTASIRVLKKIGMEYEKEFEAHGGICVQYFILKDEKFN